MDNKQEYRFLAIGDLHWGAMDSTTMYDNLQLVIEFIYQMSDRIDFVVICGDYFDHRIQLNSRTASYAIRWFDDLVNACEANGVTKIRIIKGTRDHDNDQLEIFRHYEEIDSDFIRIYNTTEEEYLYPNLKVIFCPDENVSADDYDILYYEKFKVRNDLGFFHGNFNTILPQIEHDRIRDNNLPIMVYDYHTLSTKIKGPMISGHWHNRDQNGSLYYIGSYDRWKFGEEDPKGFIYGIYNTIDSSYYIRYIDNIFAVQYDTIIVDNNSVSTPQDFSKLEKMIKDHIGTSRDRLRLQYVILNDNSEAMVNFSNFQKRFANSRQVKIDIKDMIKREFRKNKKEKSLVDSNKYQYIFDRNIPISTKIQRFVLDRKSEEIGIDIINETISKYL